MKTNNIPRPALIGLLLITLVAVRLIMIGNALTSASMRATSADALFGGGRNPSQAAWDDLVGRGEESAMVPDTAASSSSSSASPVAPHESSSTTDSPKQLQEQEEAKLQQRERELNDKIRAARLSAPHPAWAHGHWLLVHDKDHNDAELVLPKLAKELAVRAKSSSSSSSRSTSSSASSRIDAIVLRERWQAPSRWGAVNPELYKNMTQMIHRLRCYGVRVLLEVSSFLPRNDRSFPAEMRKDSSSHFIRSTGEKDQRSIRLDREMDGGAVVEGTLLDFNSSKVQQWAGGRVANLLRTTGASGFVVDCADRIVGSRRHRHGAISQAGHVSQRDYAQMCQRWFYDIGRRIAGPSFVTAALVLRRDPESGLYNENGVSVDSATVSIAAPRVTLSFHGLRESVAAVSHAFYAGLSTVTVFPLSDSVETMTAKMMDHQEGDKHDVILDKPISAANEDGVALGTLPPGMVKPLAGGGNDGEMRALTQDEWLKQNPMRKINDNVANMHELKHGTMDTGARGDEVGAHPEAMMPHIRDASSIKDDRSMQCFFDTQRGGGDVAIIMSPAERLAAAKRIRRANAALRWAQFGAQLPIFVSTAEMIGAMMEADAPPPAPITTTTTTTTVAPPTTRAPSDGVVLPIDEDGDSSLKKKQQQQHQQSNETTEQAEQTPLPTAPREETTDDPAFYDPDIINEPRLPSPLFKVAFWLQEERKRKQKMTTSTATSKKSKAPPPKLTDYFWDVLVPWHRQQIAYHHAAATEAFASRLVFADHHPPLPADPQRMEARGVDNFELHRPRRVVMWPASPQRIHGIAHPLFWELFSGNDVLVAPVVFDFGARHTSKTVRFPAAAHSAVAERIGHDNNKGLGTIHEHRAAAAAAKSATWWYLPSAPGEFFRSGDVVQFDHIRPLTVLQFRRLGSVVPLGIEPWHALLAGPTESDDDNEQAGNDAELLPVDAAPQVCPSPLRPRGANFSSLAPSAFFVSQDEEHGSGGGDFIVFSVDAPETAFAEMRKAERQQQQQISLSGSTAQTRSRFEEWSVWIQEQRGGDQKDQQEEVDSPTLPPHSGDDMSFSAVIRPSSKKGVVLESRVSCIRPADASSSSSSASSLLPCRAGLRVRALQPENNNNSGKKQISSCSCGGAEPVDFECANLGHAAKPIVAAGDAQFVSGAELRRSWRKLAQSVGSKNKKDAAPCAFVTAPTDVAGEKLESSLRHNSTSTLKTSGEMVDLFLLVGASVDGATSCRCVAN